MAGEAFQNRLRLRRAQAEIGRRTERISATRRSRDECDRSLLFIGGKMVVVSNETAGPLKQKAFQRAETLAPQRDHKFKRAKEG
jgi:hypothetical protein